MTHLDNGFAKAQRQYEAMMPPDDGPDTTCTNCDGNGTVATGSPEEHVCHICHGHGNMDAEIAEQELERKIYAAECREEQRRDDGHEE